MKNILDKLGTLPQFIDGSSSGSMWRLADPKTCMPLAQGKGVTTIFVRLQDVMGLLQTEPQFECWGGEFAGIREVKPESSPYYLPLGRGSDELAKLAMANGWHIGTKLDGIFDDGCIGDSPSQKYFLEVHENSPEGFVLLGPGSAELMLLASRNKWELHVVMQDNSVSEEKNYEGNSPGNIYCVEKSDEGSDAFAAFAKAHGCEALAQRVSIDETYYLPLGPGSDELADLAKANGWNLVIKSNGTVTEGLRGDCSARLDYLLKAPESSPEGYVSLGKGSSALAAFAKSRGWRLFAYDCGKLVDDWSGYDDATTYYVKKV